MTRVAQLVEHLESYLGEIDVGWTTAADGADVPFSVVRFSAIETLPDCAVFSTLGLSRFPLPARRTGKRINHELMMMVPERLRTGPVPGLLQQLGSEVITSGSPLLRGDVVGPRGSLFAESVMQALYAALPVYLPDSFAEIDHIAIVWMVPISRKEAEFVVRHGWQTFESLLVDSAPDLIEVARPSIVN